MLIAVWKYGGNQRTHHAIIKPERATGGNAARTCPFCASSYQIRVRCIRRAAVAHGRRATTARRVCTQPAAVVHVRLVARPPISRLTSQPQGHIEFAHIILVSKRGAYGSIDPP